MPKLRDPSRMQTIAVMLRFGKRHVLELDRLVTVNKRSRRAIIETLIHEAAMELKLDPTARINP